VINHCAVACPVVTEAVKAATPESKIAMAIAAIESDKISLRAAAERFGVPAMTLQRKTPTVPSGTVGDERIEVAARKGKDGRSCKPPAKHEEIDRAWEMKESGMSAPAIAKDLGRGEETVRRWLKKPRPETTAPPDPKPEPLQPLVLENPPTTTKPKRPKIPDALKSANQKEQRWLNERWLPIAEHLKAAHDLIRAEKERLCKEYAGPQGSLIMQRRWQQLGEAWAEAGLLTMFSEATGNPTAVTMPELLAEFERSSRMANGWITCLAVYTGCKQDSNRYAPTDGNP
jgi:hypothetical protein